MNVKSTFLAAASLLLASSLACGEKGSGVAVAIPAVTVATPLVTAPPYISLLGTAHVKTQPQRGCTYNWTLSGDKSARIGFGQNTDTIAISGFQEGGETLKVSVIVHAVTGNSSASGSTTINVLPPTEGH